MKSILQFIRLIRPLNLLIIVFTMLAIRYGVVGKSVFDTNSSFEQFPFKVSTPDFILLVFSTVLIAAAGYIINDYFDMKIDRVNKPERVIVGRHIKKRSAMLWHVIFNVIAIGVGAWLSWKYRNIYPLAIHLFTTFTLWMYSLTLKRQFLTGNLAIALLAGLVVLLTGWFDLPELREKYQGVPGIYPFNKNALIDAGHAVWIYASFAFLATLIREIQKDLADMRGDATQKCKTVPLVLGVSKTRQLILILLLLLVASIAFVQVTILDDAFSNYFITFLVIVPMLASAAICSRANDRKQFLLSGQFMKLAMFTAVLYAFFMP